MKFCKKFKEQSLKFLRNVCKFWRKFLKTFTDCKTVEMWWNFSGNLWKLYKKEKLAESWLQIVDIGLRTSQTIKYRLIKAKMDFSLNLWNQNNRLFFDRPKKNRLISHHFTINIFHLFRHPFMYVKLIFGGLNSTLFKPRLHWRVNHCV